MPADPRPARRRRSRASSAPRAAASRSVWWCSRAWWSGTPRPSSARSSRLGPRRGPRLGAGLGLPSARRLERPPPRYERLERRARLCGQDRRGPELPGDEGAAPGRVHDEDRGDGLQPDGDPGQGGLSRRAPRAGVQARGDEAPQGVRLRAADGGELGGVEAGAAAAAVQRVPHLLQQRRRGRRAQGPRGGGRRRGRAPGPGVLRGLRARERGLVQHQPAPELAAVDGAAGRVPPGHVRAASRGCQAASCRSRSAELHPLPGASASPRPSRRVRQADRRRRHLPLCARAARARGRSSSSRPCGRRGGSRS